MRLPDLFDAVRGSLGVVEANGALVLSRGALGRGFMEKVGAWQPARRRPGCTVNAPAGVRPSRRVISQFLLHRLSCLAGLGFKPAAAIASNFFADWLTVLLELVEISDTKLHELICVFLALLELLQLRCREQRRV